MPGSPGQTLLLLRQDGAVYQFDPLSGGGYVSHEPDIDGSLTTDGATVWTFTDRGDTVESYDFHSGTCSPSARARATSRRCNMTPAAISPASPIPTGGR